MSFISKIALVTGATGAIGSAICVELLKNGVKHLAALDIHSDKPQIVREWSEKFQDSSIKYFQVDVSSSEDLKKCYEDFTRSTKSLDIVVNCAGIFNENDFEKVVDVNLKGVIGSTLQAIEYMRADSGKGRGGIVMNIASIAGIAPFRSFPTYSATKHGVVAFTRAVADGRDNLGIRFLILCPGATISEIMNKVFNPNYDFMSDKNTQEAGLAKYIPQSPSIVGEAAVKVMKEGKNGSVWVINNAELTENIVPDIKF